MGEPEMLTELQQEHGGKGANPPLSSSKSLGQSEDVKSCIIPPANSITS